MINLKAFSAKDDPRPYLNMPWQEDGNSFATNGHIPIQLDGVAGPSIPTS